MRREPLGDIIRHIEDGIGARALLIIHSDMQMPNFLVTGIDFGEGFVIGVGIENLSLFVFDGLLKKSRLHFLIVLEGSLSEIVERSLIDIQIDRHAIDTGIDAGRV